MSGGIQLARVELASIRTAQGIAAAALRDGRTGDALTMLRSIATATETAINYIERGEQ